MRIVIDSPSESQFMRILQICSARDLGGGEKHLADLANALARREHDVFAAVVPGSPLLGELSALPKENILELPLRNSLNILSAFKLARLLKDLRIEIIHAHVARDYPLAALAASRADPTQLVLTRHVLFHLHKSHRLTLRYVARVIAVSRAVSDRLRAQRIFDRARITVVHNGIDIERFARGGEGAAAKPPGARLRVGMIGHLAPIKGQKEFLRAAAIVCKSRDDVDFVIVGEDKSYKGENRRRLEKLIGELNLGKQVILQGWTDDVPKLLGTLDLFVSPARAEPFGLSIVEAMAAGVPVLATMSEGACEIIDPDQTGRLVPLRDVDALAGEMLDLLQDGVECQRLSANARRAVRDRFSLERMVDETENVYREVLTARKNKLDA
jgi:glycosyltransferase involved in cell wall biosynthesis